MGIRRVGRVPEPDVQSPQRRQRFRVRLRRVEGRRRGVESSTVTLPDDICQRVMHAHDARFDGIFFVAVTTTGIYCRPVCPSRMAQPQHRRFFESAASAEHAGYRPCLRCRPELAPGRALIDAVPRLAHVAASQIAAGALNGHTVSQLAGDLGVSARHLRRAMQREIGVSPNALAQTHRLLLAKRLLIDTALPVTRVAFASGFQSLRRFRRGLPRRAWHPASARRNPRRHCPGHRRAAVAVGARCRYHVHATRVTRDRRHWGSPRDRDRDAGALLAGRLPHDRSGSATRGGRAQRPRAPDSLGVVAPLAGVRGDALMAQGRGPPLRTANFSRTGGLAVSSKVAQVRCQAASSQGSAATGSGVAPVP